MSAALGATKPPADANQSEGANDKGELTEELMAVEAPRPDQLENGANVWPGESAEAAFMAEQKEQGVPMPVAVADANEETESNTPLPKLDDLVKRISPEARELMDELFRAKFVSVRRVPKKALKG